jgi:peptide/nickel transport system permease protein
MLTFIIRRLLAMIPLLMLISILVFFLMSLAPGNALDEYRSRKDISPALIAQLEREYGYKDIHGNPNPGYVRYFHWVNTASPVKFVDEQGQFTWHLTFGVPSLGESFEYRVPVTTLLMQRVPATVALEISSLLLAWILAVPLGVLAAIRQNSFIDRFTSMLAYGALSFPEYFLGLLLIIPAAKTGWLPIGGRSSYDADFFPPGARIWDYGWHLILPTVVLGAGTVAGMMRVMRMSTLDYLRAEFVTTARAKGVPEGRIMFVHVLRNAINPLITTFGLAIGNLLSGALLVEIVMSYPGLGRLIYDAFLRHDEFVVMASVLVGSVMLVLGNLLADILLALSDPRIRLEKMHTGSGVKHRGANLALLAAVAILLTACLGIYTLPWDDSDKLNVAFGRLEMAGAVFLILAAGMFLWFSLPTLKKLLRSLPRHPLIAAATATLAVFYAMAFFAETLSTQPIGLINLKNTFHSPSRLTWQDGRWWTPVYTNVDPPTAHYEEKPGALVPLKVLGHGFKYNLLGYFLSDDEERELAQPRREHSWGEKILAWFETDRHLIVVDQAALLAQFGPATDPTDYPLYLLGSDSTGRDLFSRLLYGARISLTIGLVGIGITLVMGFLVGGLAGYFGGSFDFFAMRAVEFLMAMPTLYLLMALRAALAPHFGSSEMYLVIIVILSLIGWAGTARVLRGMSLSLRERPFVTAAECLGQSTGKILFKHFLPNLAGYLLVAATLSIPGYILGEATLSFLGIGIQEPSASWGLMLAQAQDMKVMMLNFWWMLLPGVAIFVTVVSFNLLGDALRDIVDPKMKTR